MLEPWRQGGENRGPQMRRDGDGLKLDAAEVAAGGLLARFPDQPDGWRSMPVYLRRG